MGTACQPEQKATTNTPFILEEMPAPVGEGGEPHLWVGQNERLLLSYVAYLNDTTNALQVAFYEQGQWSPVRQVAQGSDWFVNWADFPSVVAFPGSGNDLAAHWLQMAGPDTYDYNVRISLSADSGEQWSEPFTPHRDSLLAEHGFVSMLPLGPDSMLVVWLDGRYTKTGGDGHGSHGHQHGGAQGAMTLRAAVIDKQGRLYSEEELDHRICDCCQTSAALTDTGPVVIYRDRSEAEIRDMSIVRRIHGQWTKPRNIHPDNWTIAGCPVNGPAIDARGMLVVAVWFTEKDKKGIVRLAFSEDAAENFGRPVQLNDGSAIGRVDVALLPSGNALATWIEHTANIEEASVMMAEINARGQIIRKNAILHTKSSRQSGFPRLAVVDQNAYLAWTQVDSTTRVKIGTITF